MGKTNFRLDINSSISNSCSFVKHKKKELNKLVNKKKLHCRYITAGTY